MKEQFTQIIARLDQTPPSFASSPDQVIADTPAYGELIALGPSCLGLLRDHYHGEGKDDLTLLYVASRILKAPVPEKDRGNRQAMVRWLNEAFANGYEKAAKAFPALREAWAERKKASGDLVLWYDEQVLDSEFVRIRDRRRLTPLGEVYMQIRDLGIQVLPSLVDAIREGDSDFVLLVQDLTDGQAPESGDTAKQAIAACVRWWEENEVRWRVPADRL